jgi:hypothetical protein
VEEHEALTGMGHALYGGGADGHIPRQGPQHWTRVCNQRVALSNVALCRAHLVCGAGNGDGGRGEGWGGGSGCSGEGLAGQERAREGKRGQERAREGKRGPERGREGQRGQERAREGKRGEERAREGKRGQERARGRKALAVVEGESGVVCAYVRV